MKDLYIAEKPSVAAEFARVLNVGGNRRAGYLESGDNIVTWCVGHLVSMSYPEKYDPALKRWTLESLPFLPKEFRYEVIKDVKPQFEIVKGLLNRPDVGRIYICTDSGREGEYIYRLVDQMAGVKDKERRRVWIDSQTEEEIRRGIREAKDWSAYDNLSAAAYLRAKEDYLMGINFSRVLTLKYGNTISGFLKQDRTVLSVGRVMTCVLGMTVRREREIRDFVKTPFFRVTAEFEKNGMTFSGEWRAVEGSMYFGSPKLYKENGFKERKDAEALIGALTGEGAGEALVLKNEKKKEVRNAPLLYNLAEAQNDCSKRFRISPDETLKVIQGLYEKKLVTYPRTDARVLSTAVAKEIGKNINGLKSLPELGAFAEEILENGSYKGIAKTRYTNDSQITDHYAIIPTGQGLGQLKGLSPIERKVYDLIVRRFLSIFYPPAVFEKRSAELQVGSEHFFSSFRFRVEEGWQKVAPPPKKKAEGGAAGGEKSGDDSGARDDAGDAGPGSGENEDQSEGRSDDPAFITMVSGLRKGSKVSVKGFEVKEGETSPPRRYTSGSMILAMENAGQLIEDEELRSQIRGSGIGTSATRAEILKKLVTNKYLTLNSKTQVITPTLLGEMVFEAVSISLKPLLNPELTASWEKGLTMVSEGSITSEEYMEKLEGFVRRRTDHVRGTGGQYLLKAAFDRIRDCYAPPRAEKGRTVKRYAKRTSGKGRNDRQEKEGGQE